MKPSDSVIILTCRVEALSFSQVTSNDYDRLGVVVAEITPQSIANLMGSAYLRDSGTGRIFNHANWQSIGISFLMAMQLIRGHNEASSRMSINQWLYTLIELWELMDIAAPAIVPELVISHKKHSPTQVKFQNYITIITGVTDYGLIVYPADELGRAVEGDILEHLAAQPFFIIEAKRKGENLLDHIRKFLLNDWLFGIVEIPPLNKRDSKRKIWHTGVTSWTAIEMGQPITIDSFPISLIQMISLWVSEHIPCLFQKPDAPSRGIRTSAGAAQ
ncbi:hypothetical protein BD779DRAFT_1574305 [Infundibulicybe gibba]|nr:hypothetical protein BD779DRAFT_1574305 [Infundibulicybe gibba]